MRERLQERPVDGLRTMQKAASAPSRDSRYMDIGVTRFVKMSPMAIMRFSVGLVSLINLQRKNIHTHRQPSALFL